ncbi:hypothetical protein SAMN05660413_02393 [Salegentibacter flavus]|uniref:Uncharacterized protein n=1 Tax=Salegentibacter flavus TaxID=287099 RepID=A0A1I5BHV3_9FLAO|nr:hypothetical protein SAMN05660413_02393 [Salegentibacter flavus]
MYVWRKLYTEYPKRGNTSNHNNNSPHWDKGKAVFIKIDFWHLFLQYGDKCTGFYLKEK